MALTSLVVREYDEALSFFVDTLGFELIEDTYIPEQDKRWVVVALKLNLNGESGGFERIRERHGRSVWLHICQDSH